MTPLGDGRPGDNAQHLDDALTCEQLVEAFIGPAIRHPYPWSHLPVYFSTETGDQAITDVRFESDRIVLLGEEGT